MARPKSIIIIPNYNGKELLARFLPGVLRAAHKSRSQILVADDGSPDDDLDWLARNFPRVKTLASPNNLGFNLNCNRAIKSVDSEVVILLNNDMEVEEDFIDPLIDQLMSSESVFAASPSVINLALGGQDETVTYFRYEHGMIKIMQPCLGGASPPESATPIGVPHGGAAAIDRAKFLELDGFSPIFAPAYLEDVDLGYRAWKRGWSTIYEPRSVVHHHHHQTTRKVWTQKQINHIVLERRFWLTWHNLTDRDLIANHLLWLPRFPVSYLRHGKGPEFTAYLTAFKKAPAIAAARKKYVSALSDREVMERSRPELDGNEG